MLDADTAPALTPPAPSRRAISRRGPRTALLQLAVGVVLLVTSLSATTIVGVARAGLGVAAFVLILLGGCTAVGMLRGRPVDASLVASTIWLVALAVAAATAGVLPLAEGRDPSKALTSPSMLPPQLLSEHPLGTDSQALDVLSQLLYGARVSLVVAGGAVLIAFVVGGALGVCSGYFRGRVEAVIGFFTDALLAFPALILLLALVTVLKPSVFNVTIALGVLGTPGTVRLARASTLAVASREFVTASRTLGARTPRIIFGEVVPNVVPSLIAYSFVAVGFLIVAEASLSFLGLGIQRPNPTWGNLISQGQAVLSTSPWLVAFPSIFLFLTVLATNYIGQRLQQKWSQ